MTSDPHGFNSPSVDYKSLKVHKETYQVLRNHAISIRGLLAMAGGRKIEALNGVAG